MLDRDPSVKRVIKIHVGYSFRRMPVNQSYDALRMLLQVHDTYLNVEPSTSQRRPDIDSQALRCRKSLLKVRSRM